MVDVRDDYERILQAGGQVVAVTMGTPQQADEFRRKMKLPFECLSDVDQVAYDRYQLGQAALSQMAGPQVWLPGLKALFRGGAGIPVGDVRQLQGTFLIDREGVIRWAHRGQSSADLPAVDEMLQALTSVGLGDSGN